MTFVPSPGTIRHFFQPGGPGVRVDTFAHEGCEISPYYDSMIAKLMTHGRDRAEAIARMKRCLDVMVVEGIKTNIPMHRRILEDPDFLAGRFDTRFMERFMPPEEGERGVVSAPGTPSAGESRLSRWLPLLLVPVALLTDLVAAVPRNAYFFRDSTVTFLPLRLFAARELREGRFPSWNPYVFEGTFQLPALYPPDLLHVLWPSPAFVSWLLTLHLPLAALSAFWLARELGASRPAAFLAGAAYALGGFALSCLNLYVFLQALAIAPLVAGTLRRAAVRGGRPVVVAGLRSWPWPSPRSPWSSSAQAVALGVGAGPRRHAAHGRGASGSPSPSCWGSGWLQCPWPSSSACCRRPPAGQASPPTSPSATPCTRPCSCSP